MQKIVSGDFRGRRLLELPPQLEGVRPTSSRVRSAIFDRLQFEVVGARILDLCAGTGALSIEALSRGAADTTLVEENPQVAAFLKQQFETLRIQSRGEIIIRPALDFLASVRTKEPTWNLVLFDPPYHERELYLGVAQALIECRAIADEAIVVCEHEKPGKGIRPLFWPRGLALDARREYGSTWLDFLRIVRDDETSGGGSPATREG